MSTVHVLLWFTNQHKSWRATVYIGRKVLMMTSNGIPSLFLLFLLFCHASGFLSLRETGYREFTWFFMTCVLFLMQFEFQRFEISSTVTSTNVSNRRRILTRPVWRHAVERRTETTHRVADVTCSQRVTMELSPTVDLARHRSCSTHRVVHASRCPNTVTAMTSNVNKKQSILKTNHPENVWA